MIPVKSASGYLSLPGVPSQFRLIPLVWHGLVALVWFCLVPLAAQAQVRGDLEISLDRADLEISLDRAWEIRFDAKNVGLEQGWGRPEAWTAPEEMEALPPVKAVTVPGPWELEPDFAEYDGVAWYHTTFTLPPESEGRASEIRFDGVNYACTVFLDGREAGSHEGGYRAFSIPVTDFPAGQAIHLVVRVVDPGAEPVEGMTLDRIPHAKESWYYNFGGITGSVRLRMLPLVRIEDLCPFLTAPAGVDSPGGNRIFFRLANRTGTAVEVRYCLALQEEDTGKEALPPLSGTLTLPPGSLERNLALEGADLKPWQPGAPALYTAHLEIESDQGSHSRTVVSGARLFEMKAAGFFLNGEKIYLKGILYQPYYPMTLAFPPTPDWIDREITDIRDGGFNFVRTHIRPAPRAFLEACDRAGLLVMAEPAFGWIYEKSDALEERAMDCLEGLILEERHHPSIVWWGMCNELSGVVFELAPSLMERTRALDPTRLITDDSGGWAGVGSYLAPFETTAQEYLDYHVYLPYPLSQAAYNYIEALGDGERPAFISEFGFGGMDHFEKTAAFFKDHQGLPDGKEYVENLREARIHLEHTALKETFPDLEAMIDGANELQAEGALATGGALLKNKKLAGYCFTQYQNASWESSAGIIQMDGSRKAVFHAMERLNRLDRGDQPREAAQPLIPEIKAVAEGLVFVGKNFAQVTRSLSAHRTISTLNKVTFPPLGKSVILWCDALSLTKAENIKIYLRMMNYVRYGGTLVFLKPPVLDRGGAMGAMNYGYEGFVPDLPVQVHTRMARGSFVGHFHYFAKGTGFLGDMENPPLLLGAGFGNVLPHHAHLPMGPKGCDVLLGSYDAYGHFAGAGLLSIPFGKGRIIISDLNIILHLGKDPMADYLLHRIVEYALTHTSTVEEKNAFPRPPSMEMAENLSQALDKHRQYLSLGERLSIQRLDGVRARYHLFPEQFNWNRVRMAGLRQLIAGDYGAAYATLVSIDEKVDTNLKSWLELEEKLKERVTALQQVNRSDPRLRQAKRYYLSGLQALWDGKKSNFNLALTFLVPAIQALPEVEEK